MNDGIRRNEAEERRLEALDLAMAPIVPYLKDDQIIEIILNADGAIWIERMGAGMSRTDVRMDSRDAFRMLQLVASATNTEVTDQKPSLAALVPGWGARLQAMVPPVTEAPVFTIRKPPKRIFTLDDYERDGIITAGQTRAIRAAVQSRLNILVAGSTGSGKTTLTNAILNEIASATTDRVYIVEDLHELQCSAPNKLQLWVQPGGGYTWQRAIMDALRSRPDRIVVGEIRDGLSTLELIKAWNTGHPGGLATVHANDTRAALERVCQLVEEVVPTAPRPFIGSTINLCIHVARDRLHPAGRRITGIDQVRGLDSAGRWLLEPVL
jgi:P-type conjugative transfer ATPase TrbB